MSEKKRSSKTTDIGNVYDSIFKQVMEDLALTILNRFRAIKVAKLKRLTDIHNQLTILSRLRKLESQTITNINAMPITIDIQQDYLYNKGRVQL